MRSAVQIRAQIEATLGAKVPSPFSRREANQAQMISTGHAAVDALTGGVPRSSLTEISGPPSSGRTALELALLASLTAKDEACALIDAEDTFDPVSAQAAGVVLERLLWVRCSGLGQALHGADLLLAAGGFGAVVLDLAGIPARWTRRVPLSYWFRFRRAVEYTPTVLMLVDQEPCAQSSASLVLRLETEGAVWSENRNLKFETRNSGFETRSSKVENRDSGLRKPLYQANLLPHVRLLRGIRWRAEVIRNRTRNSKLENRNLWMRVSAMREPER